MSFKSYDKQTFIIDTANAYTQRKISKRDFLSKMGDGRHRHVSFCNWCFGWGASFPGQYGACR